MTRYVRRRALLAISLYVTMTGAAHAQGTLGGQGFGYPPGQLSTRAIGQGGANAELDPLTPRNPGAVSLWGRAGLHLQYDPEIRNVDAGAGAERTLVARFPLLSVGTPLIDRLSASVSISALLDRTYTTSVTDEQLIDGEPMVSTSTVESGGGVNDVRLALAWAFRQSFRVGIAGHVATGENRVRLTTTFDRPGFAPVLQASEVSYTGTTVSAGFTWLPIEDLSVGASGRLEGSLRATRNDSTLATGRFPSRAGVSLVYGGIAGATLAAGANWEQWSALDPIGSAAVVTNDTREIDVGAEVDGPRFRGSIVSLRAGGRWRTLPFEAAGSAVREQGISGGFGIPLANVGGAPRAVVDLAVQRSARSGPSGIRETAWTMSFGLTIRP
jgi:hypothetical protein